MGRGNLVKYVHKGDNMIKKFIVWDALLLFGTDIGADFQANPLVGPYTEKDETHEG